MRKYELMLILPAEADDKALGGVTDRVTQILSASGGEITKTDRWGRRRLAYELDRLTEGFYLILEFTADPVALRELDRVLALADEVIRFKIMLLPEKSARRRQVERAPGSEATPAPVPVEEEAAADVGAVEEPAGSAASGAA